MRLLRELSRRRLRTSLTVLGITIGIWALVVFSAMATKINGFVDSGSDYYVGKIIVSDASAGGIGVGLVPLEVAVADDIRSMPGVLAVDVQVQVPFGETDFAAFGMPEIITGHVAGADAGLDQSSAELVIGRDLTVADEGSRVTVLGSDLARSFDVRPGDRVDLRGVSFEVVGVLQPTLTAPDTTAMVPLAAAQDLFHATLPAALQAALDPRDLASQLIVYPAEGSVDAVAERIEGLPAKLATMTSADFEARVGSTTLIFNAIIVGVAIISLVVGGLSVINTMAMSVSERTREIGIKRAIGGSRGRIVRDLVAEAGLIGLMGGVLGLALGAIVVALANEVGRASGTILFDLTGGTAAFAVGFSTVLGMAAGIVPAWSAARLDPVQALRYQ
jgi:putative ABC transport system permease protein